MTLYLTSAALIKNNLGADYAELTDASIEAMAVKAEAYVFYYTQISPVIDGETYSFPTDSMTLGEMMAAAEDLAVSYCIAKILTIEAAGMDYKIGQMEVSKEPMSRALQKMMFAFKNSAKDHLENISDGPKRPRNAYLMKPTSSSTSTMESL